MTITTKFYSTFRLLKAPKGDFFLDEESKTFQKRKFDENDGEFLGDPLMTTSLLDYLKTWN